MSMRNFLLFIFSSILSILLAYPVGKIIFWKFNLYYSGFSSFIIPESYNIFIEGLFPAFVFSLFLLYVLFGKPGRYWWVGIAAGLVVVVNFFIYGKMIFVWIVFGLIGWLLAYGINLLRKKTNGPANVKSI